MNKEIKFKLKVEKSYEGSCSLEKLLNWFGMTEEEWNALAQEEQEDIICQCCEDEIYEINSEITMIQWTTA